MEPIILAKRNGAVVKEVMPSMARLNKLLKFQLLTPAMRSPRLNIISFLW